MIPNSLLNVFNENHSFCIVSHEHPDADAISSSLALSLGLIKIGKEVYVFNKDGLPELYAFLPNSQVIKNTMPLKKYDVFVLLDCNSLKRAGIDKVNADFIVVIDHHITESSYGDIRWIDPTAVSTGELIYKLFKGLEITIDKDTAINLYASIFTDSGGFRYPSTKPETLRIGAELLETGFSSWEVAKALYENYPIKRLKLLAHSLSTLQRDDELAWITVTYDMYKATGSDDQDTEEIANYPRMIKGVEVSVFFRELNNGSIKVSFRSKDKVNVAAIAERFGGGGHINASGCTVKGSIDEIQQKVLTIVRDVLRKFNN
jgi:phosphoesterase RecJ-like protein